MERFVTEALIEPPFPPKGKNWWTDIPLRDVINYQRFAYDLDPTQVEKGFLKYAKPVTDDIIASSGTSKVTIDDNSFKVELTVDSFKPTELEVKVVDEYLVIAGSHEKREEGGGVVSRTFRRRYHLPRECSIEGQLTVLKEGTLIVEVPKMEAFAVPVEKIAEIGKLNEAEQNG